MPNDQSLIPEITDADIDWVCSLMGLDSFDEPRREFLKTRSTVDVSACPGSGKTTLVVAKLAILARKWPYRVKGICVLSHTNVAREEIQSRLGGTVMGERLLRYPHFIDTIHGFVNRFLALPWLYSNGFHVVAIDDDVTTAYRRGMLGKDYWTIQNFLNKKYNSFESLRISARDFSFDLRGKAFPASGAAPSCRLAQCAVKASAAAGYFCYDEMFVWANALLEDNPNVSSWLNKRFPVVLIDEMQDTSDCQGAVLNAVFPRQSHEIVVQRVGDPNQAIFDAEDASGNKTDPFPDTREKRCIHLPNSFRFGREIAGFASPLAACAVPPAGLCGVGPKGGQCTGKPSSHAIFLFPDDNTGGVLEAYGRHVLDVLPDKLLRDGLVTAVGAIHYDASDIGPGHAHFPKTVKHYWKEYSPEITRKDPIPRTLVQYVRVAQALSRDRGELYLGVEKIASGFIRLAACVGDISSLKRRRRPHRAIIGVLENNYNALKCYRCLIRSFLIERHPLTKEIWDVAKDGITRIARALCDGEAILEKGDIFLAWPEGQGDDISPNAATDKAPNNPGPNIYRVSVEDRHVDIRLGTIHSVKGQNHLATMVLSTYWYDHSFEKLLPWLLGECANGSGTKLQNQVRLLQTYVAMTRPSHLLCLAMRRSTLGDGSNFDARIGILKQLGWRIAELVNEIPQWKV